MPTDDRPNILWYCTDQQRFDTIAALGNRFISTPRIDRFLSTGMAFTHAYCQSPICTPSRASFLTGMYPSALAVNGNGYSYFPRHYEDRLLPHRLAKAGYDCGLVGKLHLASPARGQEPRVADGYRYFQYSHDHKGPNELGHDYAEWLRAEGIDANECLGDRQVNDEASYRQGAQLKSFGGFYEPSEDRDNVPPHLHQSHWCTDKAIEFVSKNRHTDQPWFLSVNPFDPHPPFDAPLEYYRRYDPNQMPGAHFEPGDLEHQGRITAAGVDFQSTAKHPNELDVPHLQASYYAMIEQLDHEFGRLLDFLESAGLMDNTLVVFTSDHGESLGDHGLLLKGCRFIEGLVRVPLVIAWPKRFGGGRVTDGLVELMDLAPTICEAAGMELPYYNQGLSLLPILDGTTNTHRSSVRTEFYAGINYPDATHATMYRDQRHKLVTYHGKQLAELYDLKEDPWEHCDLSRDPAYASLMSELTIKSFDASVFAHPPMPPRTNPF
ncbi:MAG: sulfatase-like hydrolase/transferase [Chromatiales bacterium]|jgi:arylsulfatase|nr:sulfatase-like hydrolase/transferase [Chromatiales bacterium]